MSTPAPHMLADRHAVESNDREPKARRAVAEFRRMLPMLNGYARTLTGNKKVRVEISASSVSATDGKIIFMRPPLALGEFTAHERRWCDRRDDRKVQRCPACRKREDIIIKLYHEIAHIAFGSFIKPSEAHIKRILTDAAMAGGSKVAEDMRRRMIEAPMKWSSYVEMAMAMNPWLKFLLNVLEDARIDSEMFSARPGTKVMYEAMLNEVYDEGIEQADPETGELVMMPWSAMPMNAQAIMCLYDVFADFDMSNYFHRDIDAVVNDDQIQDLIIDARNSVNAADVYESAFPILARLRELGYCKLPDEEPELPTEESDDDDSTGDGSSDSQDDSGSDGGDDSSDRDDDADHPEGERDEDDGSSDPEAGDDGTSGDDSNEDSGDDRDPDGEAGSSDLPADSPEEGDGDGEVDDQTTSDDQSGEDGNPDADPGDGSEGTGSDGQRESSGGDQSSDDPSGRPDEDEIVGEQNDAGGGDGDPDSSDSTGDSNDGDDADAGSDVGPDEDSVDVAGESGDGGSVEPRPNDGTPDQVEILICQVGGHSGQEGEEKDDGIMIITSLTGDETVEDIQAVVTAVIQGMFFDQPSHAIQGVRTHKFGEPQFSGSYNMSGGFGDEPSETTVAENTLGRALMRMRAAFSANARRGQQRNLKAGRVAARTLARRAPFDDERMFQKRTRITKRDYFVLIGLDISGSTHAEGRYEKGKGFVELDEPIIEQIKRAAYAQAELCYRLGVDFAIYAHTGGPESMNWDDGDYFGRDAGWMVELYEIKTVNEPWSTATRNRLRCLKPSMANLDGHTLEQYRKVLDRQTQTDKIIMYYTDGAMPAENYDEELEILQREIELCKRRGYTLMSVGVGNDDPLKYGLDMVRLDTDDDIIKVVEHLEHRLAAA